jgi:hypothetical protein
MALDGVSWVRGGLVETALAGYGLAVRHNRRRPSLPSFGSCSLLPGRTFTAGFELNQIAFSNSFPHCVHGGFGAGLRWHWYGGNFVFKRVDLL